MSLPKFPEPGGLTRDDAINLILASIAMEEVGLSHVINAEGEKIQYVLGTLEGVTGPENVTIDELLQVNDSVAGLLEQVAANQQALSDKMQAALGVAPPVPETDQGAIIPYASGDQVLLHIMSGGGYGEGAYLGFGTSFPATENFGSDINLVTEGYSIAFTVPRAGTVTGISADFTVLAAAEHNTGDIFVHALLYRAPAGSNVFSPANNAAVTLAPGVSTVSQGQLLEGSITTSVTVAKGDRLIMAFGANNNGGDTVMQGSIRGYASAGLALL